MNKQIIIINGTGTSGKDTFVEFCKKYATVTNFSSIDSIKHSAKLGGWQGEKTDKARKLLSDLKRIVSEYNDHPFKLTCDAILEFLNSDAEILFIHIREPQEIQRIVDLYNAKTLLIKRVGLDNIVTNPSDANVDNYAYDYIIENTTLESLENHAHDFVENLGNSKLKTISKN